MKRITLLTVIFALLNFTTALAQTKGVQFVNPPGAGVLQEVTTIEKMSVLSNLQIPKAVFVGLMSEAEVDWHTPNTRFVVDLYEIIYKINQVTKTKIKTSGYDQNIDLVVAGSSAQKDDLMSKISTKLNKADALKHFKFVNTDGVIPESITYGLMMDRWMQDWGEFVGYGRTAAGEMVYGIYYVNRNRGLKEVVQEIAKILNVPVIYSASETESGGNYGGNIEITPDSVLFHGDSMDEEQVNQFGLYGQEKKVELWTSWLGVGHVDEMLSVIPSNHRSQYPANYTGPRLNYSMITADPMLGLETIYSYNGPQTTISYASEPYSDEETTYEIAKIKQVITYFAEENGTFESCQQDPRFEFKYCDLVDFNMLVSNQVIEPNIVALTNATPTTNDDFIRVPQLYRPTYQYNPYTGKYQYTGGVSFLPGTSNMVVLRDHVIVPDPTFDVFKTEITRLLNQKLGGTSLNNKVHYILEKEEYHDLWGEVHCGTNVMREINLSFQL